jgi:hypothetical protein
MDRRAAGRKGGLATLAKYGREHYRELGRKGFEGLARRYGWTGHGRKGALGQLIAAGRLKDLGPRDLTPAEYRDLYHQVGLDPPEEERP